MSLSVVALITRSMSTLLASGIMKQIFQCRRGQRPLSTTTGTNAAATTVSNGRRRLLIHPSILLNPVAARLLVEDRELLPEEFDLLLDINELYLSDQQSSQTGASDH